MKSIKTLFSLFTTAGCLLLAGCRDLGVGVESELTASNFPQSASEYIAATGPVYTQLSTIYAIDYFRMQEFSTDAAIIPARDGNYDDGGQYRFLHLHTWSGDHPNVISNWEWGFGGINTCNRIIKLFENTPDSPAKTASLAELRAMRGLFYFYMMDLFGNVPITTTFGETTLPGTSKRADVFKFIESELKAALPNLSAQTGPATYGRATKWLAYSILAKMYLNAEVYTGQARYPETVAYCDSTLARGASLFALDDNYQSIFAPENGPQIKDIIFAVPYDANLVKGNQFTRFGLHTSLQNKYSIPFRPSIAMSTIPEYYAKFNLPGDVRNQTWLVGKQYEADGSPVILRTTKKGLDASYTGADGSATVNWHFEFIPELTLVNVAKMDVGNDELGKAKGIRSIKYFPDKNANPADRNQNNDMPAFRLADVILMKAEAILRGAAPTTVNGEMQTPVVLVNKIRKRAKTTEVTSIDLNGLLDERARELAWECWRRNDLIRFGKFEDKWGFKTNAETFRRLFPIPNNEIRLNPTLVQNPGY